MTCIVCFNTMTLIVDDVYYLGKSSPAQLVTGVQCGHCRAMLAKDIRPDDSSRSESEILRYIDWRKRYDSVCEEYKHKPLPNGYSFP